MSTTKKIVIGSMILLVLVAYYGYTKAKRLIAVFEKMTISPAKISNVDVSFMRINFNIDIRLTNPTYDTFDVSGFGLAKLREVNLFYDGVFLAKSMVNITSISIPEQNQLVIKNIPVQVLRPLDFITNNPGLISDMIQNFDINKITTTGAIEVAGNVIEI